jgi:hypothetical protein
VHLLDFRFRVMPTVFRLILDARSMRELSVAEQRYPAVTAVIADGLSVSQVAEKMGAKTTCAERLRACSAC